MKQIKNRSIKILTADSCNYHLILFFIQGTCRDDSHNWSLRVSSWSMEVYKTVQMMTWQHIMKSLGSSWAVCAIEQERFTSTSTAPSAMRAAAASHATTLAQWSYSHSLGGGSSLIGPLPARPHIGSDKIFWVRPIPKISESVVKSQPVKTWLQQQQATAVVTTFLFQQIWKTEIVLRSLRPPLHPTMGAAHQKPWSLVTSISLKVQKSELQIHHFLRLLQVGVTPHRSARHQPPCQQFKGLL